MGDKKFQELILDAIDQLRKRKARPDLDRICHMLGRRHGLKAPEVNDELVRLVKEGIVIKVDYKGNTSYRNAAKWVRTKSALVGSVCNYSEATSVVLTIVDALCFPTNNEAGAEPRGVSLQEIEAHLLKREAQTNINSTTLRAVLEKAVASGLLKKLSSGEFITHTVRNVPDITKTTTEPFDDPKVEKNKIGRPASTRKRFKKTHGPDFLDTTSILSSDSPGQIRCDYCLLTANANINGEPEDLLVCKDCNAKAHPSCMDYTVELAARSQMSPWQCTDCKTCTICEDSGDGDLMLFCDLCDKGFHMNCHVPPVTTKPTGKWVCSYCHKDEPNNVKKEVKQPSSKKVINSVNQVHSPLLEEAINDLKGKKLMFVCDERLKRYPDVVPCAENWSIEDVETFFQFIGYKEEAPAFREQEIDGQSLLLMKRNDVLTGLALKLGPALKIYNHIKRLQSKVSNGYNL